MGPATVGVTREVPLHNFLFAEKIVVRRSMRYSTHVSHDASRSESSSRGSVESAGPGATRATALARKRDRASEAADRQAAAHAVWTEVGEVGAADRATGVAAGRSTI